MGRVLYYLIIKPLSLLPLSILYGLSNLLFLLLYYVVGYRRKIVRTNLTKSFPEKSLAEVITIEKNYYRHLGDLIVESIRVFSMPEAEARRRCVYKNPEVLKPFAEQNRSILFVGGHHNNWEIYAITVDAQMPHQAIGLYTPIKDPFLNQKMKKSRSRFGLEMVSTKIIKRYTESHQDQLSCYIFGSDQSPSRGRNAYWMEFLNQDTAVTFGAEKYAKQYDLVVIFCQIRKLKRGHYEVEFDVLEENPRDTAHGEITERHTRMFEQQIKGAPEYWLWTHRRWKRKRDD